MAGAIDKLITGIIEREGGFTNHPADRGGPTRYGITERVARLNGWRGRMEDLPESFARDVYLRQYFTSPQFDRVHQVCPAVGVELTDTGVNMGPPTAAKFLQRALNFLNRQGKLYPDVKVDGYIGEQTLACLSEFLRHRGTRGEVVLLRVLNGLQLAGYVGLAESDPKHEEFAFGWVHDRVS